MNGWAIYALVVIVGPLLLVARWLIADSLQTRRRARFVARQANEAWATAAIVARVEQERADEAAAWPEEGQPPLKLPDPDLLQRVHDGLERM